MDCNIVVLAGHLATDPDLRVFPGGTRLLHLLVTVRSREPRRRVDVVPVSWWDPPSGTDDLVRGSRIWVAGAVQRRFCSTGAAHRSRIEVVAHHVEARSDEDHVIRLHPVDDPAGA